MVMMGHRMIGIGHTLPKPDVEETYELPHSGRSSGPVKREDLSYAQFRHSEPGSEILNGVLNALSWGISPSEVFDLAAKREPAFQDHADPEHQNDSFSISLSTPTRVGYRGSLAAKGWLHRVLVDDDARVREALAATVIALVVKSKAGAVARNVGVAALGKEASRSVKALLDSCDSLVDQCHHLINVMLEEEVESARGEQGVANAQAHQRNEEMFADMCQGVRQEALLLIEAFYQVQRVSDELTKAKRDNEATARAKSIEALYAQSVAGQEQRLRGLEAQSGYLSALADLGPEIAAEGDAISADTESHPVARRTVGVPFALAIAFIIGAFLSTYFFPPLSPVFAAALIAAVIEIGIWSRRGRFRTKKAD